MVRGFVHTSYVQACATEIYRLLAVPVRGYPVLIGLHGIQHIWLLLYGSRTCFGRKNCARIIPPNTSRLAQAPLGPPVWAWTWWCQTSLPPRIQERPPDHGHFVNTCLMQHGELPRSAHGAAIDFVMQLRKFKCVWNLKESRESFGRGSIPLKDDPQLKSPHRRDLNWQWQSRVPRYVQVRTALCPRCYRCIGLFEGEGAAQEGFLARAHLGLGVVIRFPVVVATGALVGKSNSIATGLSSCLKAKLVICNGKKTMCVVRFSFAGTGKL